MKHKVLNRTAAAILAAVLFYPGAAMAVSADHAILMDGHTGRVYYEKQADQRSLIASTTKIMTALIICQRCNVLDCMRIPKEAVGVEGSSMYLQAGEVLSIQELLYGLMLSSGNDAATALAIYCGGTVEDFVALMNEKADALGLADTHFANPHGLDAPEHYSTAKDLAVLAAYAMTDPIFTRIVSTRQITIGNRYLTNHNKLLWQVDGADGVKTGFTKAAGRILVSSAVRDGRRLICVTIQAPNDWADHAALYKDGFSRFAMKQLVASGDLLGTLPVFGGETDRVEVLAAEDFSFPVASGEQVSFLLSQKGFAYAPVVSGAACGYAYVCLDGKAVGKIPVYYKTTIEQIKPEAPSFWQRIKGGKP